MTTRERGHIRKVEHRKGVLQTNIMTDEPETSTKHLSNDNQEDDGITDDDHDHESVKYRQYLIDRTNGNSRVGDSKPPCFACFVPKPVVWFADYIEQNRLFERLGSFGCFDASNLKARRIFVGLGLGANIISLLLSIYTCFAVTENYDILWVSAFSDGVITSNTPDYYYRTILRVGIRAIAFETEFQPGYGSPIEVTEEVTTFDNLCDLDWLTNPDDCDGCWKASSSIQATLFISTLMCIPSITTSVLRLYPSYDCNCQKVFGSFAAIISIGFAIYTVMIYQFRCFRTLDEDTPICHDEERGIIGIGDDGVVCPPGYEEAYINFSASGGWIALSVACGFKIVDMFFNMAIPTPTICRDREEQRQYELLVTCQARNGGCCYSSGGEED